MDYTLTTVWLINGLLDMLKMMGYTDGVDYNNGNSK